MGLTIKNDDSAKKKIVLESLSLLEWPTICRHLSTFAITQQGRKRCENFYRNNFFNQKHKIRALSSKTTFRPFVFCKLFLVLQNWTFLVFQKCPFLDSQKNFQKKKQGYFSKFENYNIYFLG